MPIAQRLYRKFYPGIMSNGYSSGQWEEYVSVPSWVRMAVFGACTFSGHNCWGLRYMRRRMIFSS